MQISPRFDGASSRRQKTRDRLIEAAYTVFAEHGVHAASVEMIAEAAGFTRGAFYSNFTSKYELFFAISDRQWQEWFTELRAAVEELVPRLAASTEKSSHDVVGEVVSAVVDMHSEDAHWFILRTELQLLAMREPEVAKPYLASLDRFSRELGELLVTAARTLGRELTEPAGDVARLLADVYEASIRTSIIRGDEALLGKPKDNRIITTILMAMTRPAS